MSVQRCKELFLKGHNCAQAVAGGFAEEVGLTEEKAMALMSCFGAGICGTRNVCGAVLGGLMILGAIKGDISVDGKKAMYDEGKKLIEDFKSKFSTDICKELLQNANAYFSDYPMERNEEYYKQRPCLMFVETVARYVEKCTSPQ